MLRKRELIRPRTRRHNSPPYDVTHEMTLTIHMIACLFSTCTFPLSCSRYAHYQLSVRLNKRYTQAVARPHRSTQPTPKPLGSRPDVARSRPSRATSKGILQNRARSERRRLGTRPPPTSVRRYAGRRTAAQRFGVGWVDCRNRFGVSTIDYREDAADALRGHEGSWLLSRSSRSAM